jgi:pilus assembly protein CpaB
VKRGRRAALLLGCSLGLGTLAASDVASQRASLRREIGTPVAVVVAARDLRPGDRLDRRTLTVRRVPARYAPATRYGSVEALLGLRAATGVQAHADLQRSMIDDGRPQGAPVAPGERVAELTARGSPSQIVPGVRVDVVVTRDRDGGTAELVLQDAEVLTSRAAVSDSRDQGGPRVEVSLRASAAEAMALRARRASSSEDGR